jgi:hypothetical protein
MQRDIFSFYPPQAMSVLLPCYTSPMLQNGECQLEALVMPLGYPRMFRLKSPVG